MATGRTSKTRDGQASPHAVVAVAVVLAVLVVPSAAWSASTTTTSSSTTTTTSSSTTTTTAPAATGGGCGKTVRFGTSTLHVRVGGRTRTVLVHVPRSYTATIRVPLVLNLHSSGSTAAAEERLTGMDAASELDGFLVAYPQAFIRHSPTTTTGPVTGSIYNLIDNPNVAQSDLTAGVPVYWESNPASPYLQVTQPGGPGAEWRAGGNPLPPGTPGGLFAYGPASAEAETQQQGGAGFSWNIPGEPLPNGVRAPGNAPDDLAFLTLLINDLEGDYCVNPGRVYATGFAGGAVMTSVLACDDSNLFAAVAPVSGLRWPDPCPTIRAVPLLAIHGTADHVDPFRGHGQPDWTYSVPEAAADWARQDDCRSRPVVAPEKRGVEVTAYLNCPGHAAVELLAVQGGGHVWPGGTELGPGAKALDADSLIWAFFSAHRIR